ncbi:adenylate/guanylate cyclase domain-containing protein [Microbulbifer bruguierae]|uniref:Adenylate/guanylate cyclase domain-containing protein n=1 Tax=Microbulbifer bruguierae TaxID=3029061 RepID=A0ABY8NHD1_9GAMM|nr:adenylate/guanylate cyclase domain-containing protein [Microbulbifer bruguierae]WGL17769.1 adenylate/guanylate cyclase domain-containing protein [Microbulbifer bruguierae]
MITKTKATLRHAVGGLQTRLIRLLPTHIPIAFKLALVMTLLLVLGMASLGLFISDNQNHLIRTQLHDFGNTMAQQLAKQASEPILSENSLNLRMLTANLDGDQKVLGAGVYAHDGKLLSATGIQPDLSAPLPDVPEVLSRPWFRHRANGSQERLISFIAPANYQGVRVGSAVVTLSASQMDKAATRARHAIVYATLAMTLLASLLAYWLSRRLSLPIHRLMEATRAIDRGDLATRIDQQRNDEIGFLFEGFNNMAAGLLRKSQVEEVFSRYVSKSVADKVLANLDEVRLVDRPIEATVLFADITGFTAMSEKLQPSQVSALLNEYFSYISRACALYGGVVDKFIGDCAMLVFGVLEDDNDHAFNAVSCAVLIQQLAAQLNQQRRADGKPEVHFRIGINSGAMLAGNLGSDERMEFTVVGDAVNLASRLCSEAQPDQIIIRQQLFTMLEPRITAQAEQTLPIRGKSTPVMIYSVQDIHLNYHLLLQANLKKILDIPVRQPSRRAIENA